MKIKGIVHRYLDPAESLGEVLFGLIMVLTFTLGERIITKQEPLDERELVLAAIGCNIAWGVIDGVLFVLGSMFQRSKRSRFIRTVRSAGSETEALAAIRDEFELGDEPMGIRAEDRSRLHQAILAVMTKAKPTRAGLRWRDISAAVIVFMLVSVTALPGVIPFLLVPDSFLALRISNLVLVSLLFLVGYWWAHYTGAPRWRAGLVIMLLGVAMVCLAIALGG